MMAVANAERCWLRPRHQARKKADVIEHPKAFHHAGLLVNEPPGTAGLPFI